MILLHGPVGSAKSTIARLFKGGLEHYTCTDSGAIFTFDWHVDGEVIPSAMNQDPLLLCPDPARRAVEARLSQITSRPDPLRIEGELDPVSRYWLDELMARTGSWEGAMEHVRVRRFVFSESRRVGIGTVSYTHLTLPTKA